MLKKFYPVLPSDDVRDGNSRKLLRPGTTQTVSGAKVFSEIPVITGAPEHDDDLVTKGYIDSRLSSLAVTCSYTFTLTAEMIAAKRATLPILISDKAARIKAQGSMGFVDAGVIGTDTLTWTFDRANAGDLATVVFQGVETPMSYVLDSVDHFPGVFSGAGWDGDSFEYVHGAVGSDGNIYLAPYGGGTKPVRINVSDNTVSFIDDNANGEFLYHRYAHAVNGKVYSIRANYPGDTICINESTGVVSLIHLDTEWGPWMKGDLSENGKIYYARDEKVLVVDTNTDSAYTIDFDTDLQNLWGWTVHAGNGILYSAPYSSSGILRIDSLTDTVTQIGYFGETGFLKTERGLLGYDGKVYFFPFYTSFTDIICLDPSDDSTSLIPCSIDLWTFGDTWKTAVAHPNGNIYMVPYHSNAVLVVDTAAGTVREICNTEILEAGVPVYSKWMGGAVGPDGKIYCAPFHAKKIMCIDPVTETASFIPIDFSPNDYGDCYGALVSGDKMYMLPSTTSDLVVLSFRQEVN